MRIATASAVRAPLSQTSIHRFSGEYGAVTQSLCKRLGKANGSAPAEKSYLTPDAGTPIASYPSTRTE
jgi:hypothetical protein